MIIPNIWKKNIPNHQPGDIQTSLEKWLNIYVWMTKSGTSLLIFSKERAWCTPQVPTLSKSSQPGVFAVLGCQTWPSLWHVWGWNHGTKLIISKSHIYSPWIFMDFSTSFDMNKPQAVHPVRCWLPGSTWNMISPTLVPANQAGS